MFAGFLEGRARIAVWLVALAIDYLGPVVIGVGRGWRVAPEHFAERHGLIVLIALGESIIAVGVGVGEPLDTVPGVALCGGAALYLLGTSRSSSERPAESSGGGRSRRSRCSPSSRLQSRSRRLRRSPS